jgi:hypothetical protein
MGKKVRKREAKVGRKQCMKSYARFVAGFRVETVHQWHFIHNLLMTPVVGGLFCPLSC